MPPTTASPREPQRDHWQLLVEKGVLRRHHVKWRSHPFSPWEGPRMRVEIASLTCERSTSRRYRDGAQDHEEDDWKSLKPSKRERKVERSHGLFPHQDRLKEPPKELDFRGGHSGHPALHVRGPFTRGLRREEAQQRRGPGAQHSRRGVSAAARGRRGRVGENRRVPGGEGTVLGRVPRDPQATGGDPRAEPRD